MEDSEKIILVIKTDYGRYLEKHKSSKFRILFFYQAIYKTNNDKGNTGINNVLSQLPLSKLSTTDKNLLEKEISEE